MKSKKEEYKVVNFVDVNELLTFAKNEFKELEEQIKEEKRVEDELKVFIEKIERFSGHSIHHIGKERREGNLLIRFLFTGGGLLEVMGDKPLTMNAHFVNEKSAKKFAEGLKKALNKELPDHPVKDMIIQSIDIQDGFKDPGLTYDKWNKMHHLAVNHTVVVTLVALIIFIIIEWTKELFKETAFQYFNFHSFAVSIITAIIVAFFFDKIRSKVEHITAKFIKK